VVEIVPFEPFHLQWILLQPEQAHMKAHFTPAYGIWLKKAGPAYSALDGTDVVGCAGIMPFWAGRSIAWALMSNDVSQHRMAIHRAVLKVIKENPVRRLELLVDPAFPRARIWAERLGFRFESRMPYYSPMGTTQDMYVLIREDE
jgi:ribosomal protein S18 acetylase RimI-like enzyme